MIHDESLASNIIDLMSPSVKEVLDIPVSDLLYRKDLTDRKAEAVKGAIANIREIRLKLEQERASSRDKERLCEIHEIIAGLAKDRGEAREILKELIEESEFLDKVIKFKTTIVV